MIYEQSYESCRINFRSKGKFRVSDIAKALGGGGHAFAAGSVIEGSLADLKEKVVKLTKQMIMKQAGAQE